MDNLNWSETKLNNIVVNCLKRCIQAHGAITKESIGSAAKRIVTEIISHATHVFIEESLNVSMAKLKNENSQLRKDLARQKQVNFQLYQELQDVRKEHVRS